MQVKLSPRTRSYPQAGSGPWPPLAIASSLWLLLLLFGGAWLAPPEARLAAGPLPPLALLAPWQAALVLVAVGFLSGAALATLRRPAGLAAAVLVALLLWAVAFAGYGRWYDPAGTLLLPAFGLTGLILGLLAGILTAPSLRRLGQGATGESGAALSYLALGCALVAALVPFAPTSPLSAPFESIALADLVKRIPQQVYVLIKSSMLWVPLGFVFAAGGLSAYLRRWIPSGVAAFFVVAWPFLDGLRVSDLLEVLSAPVGVWLGLWMGERTGSAETPAAALEPARPAPAPATPAPCGDDAARSQTFRTGQVPRLGRASEEQRRSMMAPQPEPGAQPGPPGFALPRPHPLTLIPALALLGAAAWGWWDFPRFQPALGLALLLYLAVLAGFRHAWLVALPALLPVLDLAPWTGRFFFDEGDLFLLVTLGAALLHRTDPEAGPYLARPIAVLGGAFAATTLIALLVGLLPVAPLDANAFASYFSHYNSLRVAKGFVWGLACFLLLRWTFPRGSDLLARLLTAGLLLGLLGVVLIGVRERWQFADLWDFSTAYRITASFSSMHTGDSHLPAFLALAVPFVWLWMVRRRNPIALPAGLVLFAGAVYLVISTVTRASVLALAVELILLTLFWLRGLRGHGTRIALSALAFGAMAAVAGGLLVLGTQGGFFQQRLATVERDAGTRMDHWRLAVQTMDQDALTSLFGMGLGRFPETYLQRNPMGRIPGNFRYASEGGNGYLLLGSGETLYLAQRVPVAPGVSYRLAFDLRGQRDKLRLSIPLCEKHLLDSRGCVWNTYELPGSGEWEHKEVELPSGRIGAGNALSRPPVELFLYNGEKDQLIAVDNLSLRAPDGTELLNNGDFSAGGDFWFFKTHDHLAWHIKNLWVALLFEQGWIGLIVFNLLLLAALIHLGGPAWRGSPVPAATVTAVLGFLAVGLFASPFDAPRLTALFFIVLAVGLHAAPAVVATGRGRRP